MHIEILAIVLATVLPITLAVAIGFVMARSKRQIDTETISRLATDFAMPALVFGTLAKGTTDWVEFVRMAGAGVLSLALLGAVGAVALRCVGLRLRTYVPSLTWGNGAFIGYPVALYAFGNVGLTHAIAFAAGSQIFNCTLVQAYAAGAANWRAVMSSPLLCAVVLGVLVRMAELPLPVAVANSCSLLGGMTVPLMLILVGHSLARIPIASVTRATLFSLFRIATGALIAVGVAYMVGLGGVARSVLILQCSMPVAVLSYVFAQRWNNEPDEVAGLVVASTWMSVVSIPSLLGLLVE